MKKKIFILAPLALIIPLQRFLKRHYQVVQNEPDADILIIDSCGRKIISNPASPIDLYPGISELLERAYEGLIESSEKRGFVFLVHEKLSGDDPKLGKAFRAAEEISKSVKLPASLKDLRSAIQSAKPPGQNAATDVVEALRGLAGPPHPPVPSLQKASDLFIRGLKWNVLVIDNEISAKDRRSPHRILGYPTGSFWDQIRIVPYNAESLFTGGLEGFRADLSRLFCENDIDVVLLDLSLTKDGKEFYGFNLIGDIQRECKRLGKLNVPVVMFTKHVQEAPFMVSSLRRGASWYARKEVGGTAERRGHRALVTELPDIIQSLYSPSLWREDHRQRFARELRGNGEIKDNPNPAFFNGTFADIKTAFGGNDQKLVEVHYLFRRLFEGFDSISVQRVERGFSGAEVFYVFPRRDNLEYSIHLVKIDRFAEIERERHNFDERISGVLDAFIGRIKGEPVRASDYAALLYVAVGIKSDYELKAERDGKKPITLRELIARWIEERPFEGVKITGEMVGRFMDRLFEVLKPLHASAEKKWTILGAHIDDFPSSLQGKLHSIYVGAGDKSWNSGEVKLNSGDWFGQDDLRGAKAKVLPGLGRIRSIKPGTLLCLPRYEVYEVDRERRKLKVVNRAMPPSFKKWGLNSIEELTRLVDLRVDIDGDQVIPTVFTDPRIDVGKRVTLVISEPKLLWETDRLNFLEKASAEWVGPCVDVMAELELGLLDSGRRKAKTRSFNYYLVRTLLPKLVNQFGKAGKFKTSVIHGDLNLDNILVTASENKGLGDIGLLGWFIDFSRSRIGITAFDFVKLETEIKTHLLAPWLAKLARRAAEFDRSRSEAAKQSLAWFLKFEQDVSVGNAESEPLARYEEWEKVRYLAEIALRVRRLAFRSGLAADYNWPLFFYSVATLKFENLDKEEAMAPFPKCLAYLSAWGAYLRLRATGEIVEG